MDIRKASSSSNLIVLISLGIVFTIFLLVTTPQVRKMVLISLMLMFFLILILIKLIFISINVNLKRNIKKRLNKNEIVLLDRLTNETYTFEQFKKLWHLAYNIDYNYELKKVKVLYDYERIIKLDFEKKRSICIMILNVKEYTNHLDLIK